MSKPGETEGEIIDFFHEFGHAFASIEDEYGSGYTKNAVFTDQYIDLTHHLNYNCDPVPGCPAWCNMKPKPIQRTDPCAKRVNKKDCENQQFQDDGFYTCVWIENKQISNYFGSYCLPSLEDYGNIGNSCTTGTGCYFGCSGEGWRSSYNSLYAGFFNTTYSEYSQGGLYPYSNIQQKQIINAVLSK